MTQPIASRNEFQDLARTRRDEAKILLEANRWDGAYYLVGYALELALKACVIRKYSDCFPPDKKFSEKCFTHDLEALVALGRLSDARKAATDKDHELAENWSLVKDWSETKRYERISQEEAENMYNAVTDAQHGVLTWLESLW